MRRFKFLLSIGSLMALALVNLPDLFSSSVVRGQSGELAAPTGVSASDGSYNNKVGVSWDTMRNATRYRVFRNTANDAASAVSLGTTVEAVFFDKTAVVGQNYFYWVRAETTNAAGNLSTVDMGFRGNGTAVALEPPPAPAGNPVTATKAALGKTLFWDEQLSSTRTVACGTCHIAVNGGSDPRSAKFGLRSTHPGPDGVFGNADDIQGSIGVPPSLADGSYKVSANFGMKEQVTGRRSPSAINAAYLTLLFWDGRASQIFKDPISGATVLAAGAALESQVLGPPLSDVEMAHSGRDWNDAAARMATAKPLALSPAIPAALTAWIGGRGYPELFNEAFGSSEVTPVRIAMAIATYERTLFSDRTPFDAGNLTAAEARGLDVFNQSDCINCHTAPLFSHNEFENIGVRPATEDTGRFAITQRTDDLGRFRSPSLRNVELRAPYMHNGRFQTLEDVVEFYDRGGDFPGVSRTRLRVLRLSAQQKSDLVAFLKRPLTDPRVAAETAPFDRPMLYAESMRVPQIVGTGVAGSGGRIPQVIAVEPPLLGNPRFTVGVYSALGGAQATLVIDKNDPGAGSSIPASGSFARMTVQLTGTGAGNGYASATPAIPNDAALFGATLFGRWYVADAAAPGGIAVTPAFKFTIFGTPPPTAPAFTSVSAASFAMGTIAAESIIAGFGQNLATTIAVADGIPLPLTLGGVSVLVRDAAGVERSAPLFFVSPTQINYQVPVGTSIGEAALTIKQNANVVAAGRLQIAPVAPGLFTVDSGGRGIVVATALRVKADGTQIYEPIAQFNSATSRYELLPIDLGPETDQVFLVILGTGFRNRSSLSAVSAVIGGVNCEVLFAGAQGNLIGVDQANIRLPRSLAGRNAVDLIFSANGIVANTVNIGIK
ncbi:MAG TPA: cytochrome c peroxidase [Blastocatellia bacterium]|nr:cytochrome c peroxidase [Blastocatellia bacterium]HNG29259.1 cytochrome c peroxidase [Blastocatellia bacterium]